ncbi:MAG TPA: hypothetical protein VGR43_11075 [Dehalococcoidia bacterium]|nr:hypothetical protein [Dehalococcoidia bacterium]
MPPVITAATGFLIAVLWFDLMFDVQVWRHRRSPEVPETVLDSIAAYYRRVTTRASPMGRLVGLTMLALLGALAVQAIWGEEPVWVSVVSIPAALVGIGFAAARIFGQARRLGARSDLPAVQSELARGIFRAHLVCLAAMVTVLAVQLVGA